MVPSGGKNRFTGGASDLEADWSQLSQQNADPDPDRTTWSSNTKKLRNCDGELSSGMEPGRPSLSQRIGTTLCIIVICKLIQF